MKQNAEGESAEKVEKKLVEFMEKHFGKEIILAGNSIHQDRKFIDKEWLEVSKRLHYRMLDECLEGGDGGEVWQEVCEARGAPSTRRY